MDQQWTRCTHTWGPNRASAVRSLGSGPRYMICVTLFCTLSECAIPAWPCVFWLAQRAKTCDKIWFLGPLPKGHCSFGEQQEIRNNRPALVRSIKDSTADRKALPSRPQAAFQMVTIKFAEIYSNGFRNLAWKKCHEFGQWASGHQVQSQVVKMQ